MGKVLRVFDLDDTLIKTSSKVRVTHSDGKQTILTPGEYAVYKEKQGDKFDFTDFEKKLINPKQIKQNVDLLIRMLSNPNKKVTILTARKIGFPIRHYFKTQFGLDVYPVALGSNNPQDKADWIENHIKRGYTDIAFMDDSVANIRAVDALKSKYPEVNLRTKLVNENYQKIIFDPTNFEMYQLATKILKLETKIRDNFNKLLNSIQ